MGAGARRCLLTTRRLSNLPDHRSFLTGKRAMLFEVTGKDGIQSASSSHDTGGSVWA